MDVMENPPPVPVRRQKYWRLHLYTWYHALSSGQRGRVAQRLRFAKSQACPLPKLNLSNIGQGGSAIDSSLIVEMKRKPPPQHQLNWPTVPGSNLWVSVYNHILIIQCWRISLPANNPARNRGKNQTRLYWQSLWRHWHIQTHERCHALCVIGKFIKDLNLEEW